MQTITDQILLQATRLSKKPALITAAESISYPQLAGLLSDCGVIADADCSGGLTVGPGKSTINRILGGLKKLSQGLPIVGGTSGSTASPKIYTRSQESWLQSFQLEDSVFHISEHDTVLAHGDPGQSLFFYAICKALSSGATVLVADRFHPDGAVRAALTQGATMVYGVPSQLRLISQRAERSHVPQVRLVLSSGARFSESEMGGLKNAFPNAEICDFYGSSETSFISVARPFSDQSLPKGSVGRVFPGVTVQVLDGRIWAHSPMLFQAYRNAPPPVYQESIDPQGRRWISNGDLGWIDAHGYLFVSGRADRTINISGLKIQPEEIEDLLIQHPAIRRAAAVGLDDPLRGQRLVAAIVVNSAVHPSDLRAYLHRQLDARKLPQSFFQLDDWPQTPGGKTDFPELKRRLIAMAQPIGQEVNA